MKIRLTAISDAEGIFNVKKTTWLDIYPNKKYDVKYEDIAEKFTDKIRFITKIKKSIKGYRKNSHGWVAETGGNIVGFSSTLVEYNKHTVGGIYVLPEHQGKDIGGILLQKVLNFCKYSKELWLDVASYNTNAINFYKKYGFRVVSGSEDKYELIKGKYIPTIKMRRKKIE